MKKGWELKTLGDVCVTTQGVQIAKSKQLSEASDGLRRYLYISDFRHKKNLKYVDDIYYNKIVTENDLIVVNTGNSSGDVFRGIDGVLSNNLFKVSFDENKISTDYIHYFLKSDVFISFQDEIKRGTANPHMGHKNFSLTPISIPPLAEQKQIVAILDKAFAAIDQAKANIEQNIKNSKELFQSKLNDIFSQTGDGWVEKSLGGVCWVLNGYAFKSKDTVEHSRTQLLRMGNLYRNILDLSRKPVFYPDSFSETYNMFLLKEGDLIMSLTGTVDKTDYGYTVKIPKTEISLLLNQRIMKIEINEENYVTKDYLHNYLLSSQFLSKLYNTASGTRQANLSSRVILTLKIKFPKNIAEQNSFIDSLDIVKKESTKLENIYKQKLTNLEELKKSILQKAFKGELVY
jgi:type I restriction enzyme S subunit